MLQRYKFERKLDEGEYGEVWKAFDFYSNRHVAIKLLKNKNDPARREMFEREIRELWNEINNPHIVDILDSNLNDQQPYFVMEFCDRGNLGSQCGKTTVKELIVILRSMVIALKPRYCMGGFQRDLKPENILKASVKNGYVFKLADFGLARTPNKYSAMTRTVGGTFPYIDPEVLLHSKGFSPASDIYSLGMTGFALLNGTPEISPLLFTRGPSKLTDLLRGMTASDSRLRPTLFDIEASLIEIENDMNSEGVLDSLTSLSYGEKFVGAVSIALILIGVLGAKKKG